MIAPVHWLHSCQVKQFVEYSFCATCACYVHLYLSQYYSWLYYMSNYWYFVSYFTLQISQHHYCYFYCHFNKYDNHDLQQFTLFARHKTSMGCQVDHHFQRISLAFARRSEQHDNECHAHQVQSLNVSCSAACHCML